MYCMNELLALISVLVSYEESKNWYQCLLVLHVYLVNPQQDNRCLWLIWINWAFHNLQQLKLWLHKYHRRTMIRDWFTLHSLTSERYQPTLLLKSQLRHTILVSFMKCVHLWQHWLVVLYFPLHNPVFSVWWTGLASHLPRPKDLVKYAASCMYSPGYRSYRWVVESVKLCDLHPRVIYTMSFFLGTYLFYCLLAFWSKALPYELWKVAYSFKIIIRIKKEYYY